MLLLTVTANPQSLQQAVAEDAWPFMKTSTPPLWQHPVGPAAAPFAAVYRLTDHLLHGFFFLQQAVAEDA
jgi:hypothetical protein